MKNNRQDAKNAKGKRRRNLRAGLVFFLALLASWRFISSSEAQLALDAPYQIQVVLHVAENRFLTPLFKEQVQREARDQLQLAFGPLARVEVVSEHPLLPQILERGLQSALDGWDELSDRATHFVLIDFVQGRYELQARAHDGFTGLATPVIRQDLTNDRRLVGQRIAELVESNFSFVGNVLPAGKDAELVLKGGRLIANPERWIKPGHLFTVVRIVQDGERLRSSPIAWAVLQVKDAPRDGQCRCQWFHRFASDRLGAEPGVIGYRAVQLHTDHAPLQLQLIDEDTFRPLDGVPLQIFRSGFTGKEKPSELTTNRDGLAQSRAPYTGVAFVRILSRDTHEPRAQFPALILAGRTLVVRLKLGAESEGIASLNLRRDLLVRRIYDQHRVAAERVTELNVQLAAKSLEDALKTAETGKEALAKEIEELVLEQGELAKQARDKKVSIDLSEAREQIEQLRRRGIELEKFAAQLQAVIKESASPEAQARKQLLARARLLESQAEIEAALTLYAQFLAADPKQTEVRAHLESLKAAWTPKSEAHAMARKFIYQIWPTIEPAALKTQLPLAEKAFATCKQAGDYFVPMKLLHINVAHAGKLKARIDALKRSDSPDNRAEAKTILEVTDSFRRLHAEVTAYLKQKGRTADD